jgi:spore coat protein U-like protein
MSGDRGQRRDGVKRTFALRRGQRFVRNGLALLAGLAAFEAAVPSQAVCFCTCTVTGSPITFGGFVPLNNAALDVGGSVQVDCSGIGLLSTYDLKLSAGLYGSFAAREMRSGANPLLYNLYSNAGRTTIWGDGTGGYGAVSINNPLSLMSWSSTTSVYGRIPAAPSTKLGSYSESIVVKVEY